MKKIRSEKNNSSETGNHNKYSVDNLFRKSKGIILNSFWLIILLKKNIKRSNYDKKNFLIFQKKINFKKGFIDKKLKDIFSENVTHRSTIYNMVKN